MDRKTWLRKKESWSHLIPKTTVVCPSRWMKQMAERSVLWRPAQIEVIANSVDTNEFRPVEKNLAREMLRIDGTVKYVIVFGASSPFLEPVKGFNAFLGALAHLKETVKPEELFVITFGSSWGRRMHPDIGHKHFESTKSSELLSLIYSAADLMAVSSEVESFCLVAAEAHACGVPVVCFDTAGLKDVVDHQVTGYRAEIGNQKDFAKGMEWILKDPAQGQLLSKNARHKSQSQFEAHKVAFEHLQTYQKRLGHTVAPLIKSHLSDAKMGMQ